MDYSREKEEGTDGLVVRDPSMVQIYQKADLLATNQVSVLIYGESGTGKDCLAGYIQRHSPLSKAPFVAIHCNAIPSELFASELFGYFPNAFTGASNKGKLGLLEMADRGTVLFDAIDELSPKDQTLLLHFLQNRTITPLGSLKTKEIRTRIICTSSRDLREMIQQGTFRLDLYYRICVANIRIPPLRERREEIPWLIAHFVDRYADLYQSDRDDLAILQDKMDALCQLDWMGNIHEIENFAQKICLSISPEQAIDEHILRFRGLHQSALAMTVPKDPLHTTPDGPVIKPLKEALQDFEDRYIQTAIQETGSLQEAAERLGISYSTLCRKRARRKPHSA